MQVNGSQHHQGDRAPSLASFAAVALVTLLIAALVTTATMIGVDRLDRPELVIAEPAAPTIVAQVGGAVATPGVYPLPAGSRLADLLRRAGGLASDADVADLNLAARIGDGERIDVPSVDRATPVPRPPGDDSAAAVPLVNINTASIDELDRLPGIGPVLGERIVAWREANGPFSVIDELAEVDGISMRLVQRLRPYITLDD